MTLLSIIVLIGSFFSSWAFSAAGADLRNKGDHSGSHIAFVFFSWSLLVMALSLLTIVNNLT